MRLAGHLVTEVEEAAAEATHVLGGAWRQVANVLGGGVVRTEGRLVWLEAAQSWQLLVMVNRVEAGAKHSFNPVLAATNWCHLTRA